MDELQRSIYVDRFRVAFHTQKGAAFQDWFVRLAGHAFGPDFEEVRPYGPYGDLKCDGWRVSTATVFQCYAPDVMKEEKTGVRPRFPLTPTDPRLQTPSFAFKTDRPTPVLALCVVGPACPVLRAVPGEIGDRPRFSPDPSPCLRVGA